MVAKIDLHTEVTNAIAKAIEDGAGTFEMPWHRAAAAGTPMNATTKKSYRGINILNLWVASLANGYETNEWATYNQWKEAGAQVRQGQRSSLVIFYKTFETEDAGETDADQRSDRRFMARASRVFNASQVDGYTPSQPAADRPNTIFDRLAGAESVIAATGAKIHYRGNRACYRRIDDDILIPPATDFIGTATSTPQEAFYSTIFHELAHWTGAEHRLNREKGKRFGDRPYAFEELIALS